MNNSLIIIGIVLIISCLFYDELYNKNVENMSEEVQKGIFYTSMGLLGLGFIVFLFGIPTLQINPFTN